VIKTIAMTARAISMIGKAAAASPAAAAADSDASDMGEGGGKYNKVIDRLIL
jgi:hypothetical protein